jgi:stage IV sporulation protein FB
MQSVFWKFGKWRRIPFHFHWTILLWVPWYWWVRGSLGWAVVTLVAYLVLLLAHELGHAIAARSQRVEVYAIRLCALHGQCEHEEPYYERSDLLIAWGGVLAQLCILAFALLAKYSLRFLFPAVEQFFAPILFVFIEANLVMVAINLIPVAPLDGHKAWRALPLAWNAFLFPVKRAMRSVRRAFDFKRRRAIKIESQQATSELLERLRKK